MSEFLENIFGDPAKKRIYRYVFFAAIIFFLVIDFFITERHPHFFFEKIPGIYAVLGLLFASVIIIFAKLIYGKFVYRKESYYDE